MVMLCDTHCFVQSGSQCPAKISPGNRLRAIIRRCFCGGKVWKVLRGKSHHWPENTLEMRRPRKGPELRMIPSLCGIGGLASLLWSDDFVRLNKVTGREDHGPHSVERQFSRTSTDHTPRPSILKTHLRPSRE